jgi:23S rRNA (pseudouridine1915-N3)-methyltransferase
MQIALIAVGTKMPSWVQDGYAEYAKRMPAECRLQLVEIPAPARSKSSDLKRAIREEGERMLKAIPRGAWVVALDVRGQMHTTESLSQALQKHLGQGRDLALLVGGADGLSSDCLQRADESWSLSRLTFPHPLVRVLLAEQLYRAYSLSKNHPYHRA